MPHRQRKPPRSLATSFACHILPLPCFQPINQLNNPGMSCQQWRGTVLHTLSACPCAEGRRRTHAHDPRCQATLDLRFAVPAEDRLEVLLRFSHTSIRRVFFAGDFVAFWPSVLSGALSKAPLTGLSYKMQPSRWSGATQPQCRTDYD